MRCFSKISLLTALATMAVAFLGFLGFLPSFYLSAVIVGPAVLAGLMLLSYAQTLDAHNIWLHKVRIHSHRATEVIIPPTGLKKISHLLKEGGKKGKKDIQAFTQTYKKGLFLRLVFIGFIAFITTALSLLLYTESITYIKLLGMILNLIPQDIQLSVASPYYVFALWATLLAYLAAGADILKAGWKQNKARILDEDINTHPMRKWAYTLGAVIVVVTLAITAWATQNFREEAQATQQAVKNLENKTTNLKSAHEELLEKSDFLAKENAELAQKLAAAASSQKSLSADKAEALKKIKALQKKQTRLQEEKQQATNKVSDLQAQISELEESISTENANTTQRIKNLETDLSEAFAALEKQQEITDLTKGRLEAFEAELAQAKQELSAWQSPVTLSGKDWGDKVEVVNDGKMLRILAAVFYAPEQPHILLEENSGILADIGQKLQGILAQATKGWLIIKAHSNALPPQTGAYSSNAVLTALQAEKLKAALAEAGIEKNRILATGLGHQQELDSRLTKEALARNNRIEMEVVRLPF